MFETSKDLLYIVIAVCVGLFTIFSCWIMFYAIMILRNVFKVVHDIKEKIEKFEKALDRSATHLGLMVEVAKEVVKYLAGKKMNKKSGGEF
ncbi:MAG: hypothetical protein U9P90_01700 [Patescibacteria group bacterium]|nr:hypothetical protein [Patescibacteria group bacterium]